LKDKLEFEGDGKLSPATYISIIFLCIIIFILFRNQRKAEILRKIIEKKKLGGNAEMKELAQRFIDKECLFYFFNGNQYEGVIKEVTDGAILVEKDGKIEMLNLDFVIRIREYPHNKNGKKKSVVLD